ncbi:MAG: hypothetical protein IJ506_03730 [Clostridia bacterium]|nr:hypothetical protein [Clostridia bacterium]
MKKKVLGILLSICMVACVGGALGACGVENAEQKPSVETVAVVTPTLTIKEGEHYRLKTDDGVAYYTYRSENTSVCTVTPSGIVYGIGAGTATIVVETYAGQTTCTVNVLAVEEKVYSENNYYISLTENPSVKTGDKVSVVASVYNNGMLTGEAVAWNVEETQVVSVEEEGNILVLTGKTAGTVSVTASIGNVRVSTKVKVYGAEDVLPSPTVSFGEGKITWSSVENAAGYEISTDGGKTWTKVASDVLEMQLNVNNPANVCVVALAAADSRYVNSAAFEHAAYTLSQTQLNEHLVSYGTVVETEDTLSVSLTGEEEDFGRKFLSVYGEQNSLFDNGGELSVFAETVINFEIKSETAGEIVFVSEAENGEVALSRFAVGGDWTAVGYKMDAYAHKCYVLSSAPTVSIKNARLENRSSKFTLSSTYLAVKEIFESGNSFEKIEEITANYAYLSKAERGKLGERYAEELQAIKTYYKIEDAETDVWCINHYLKLSELTSSRGEDNLDVAFGEEYVDGTGMGIIVYPHAGDISLNYHGMLPEEEPAYDYYIWRIWSSMDRTGMDIGATKYDLTAGWNDIYLTWSIVSHAEEKFHRIYIYPSTDAKVILGIGSLTGYNYASGYFLGQEMTTDKFENSSAHVCYAEGGIGVYADGSAAGAGGVNFSAYLPTEDPGYDYYEVKVYSENALTAEQFHFSGKWMALEKGWNTITLTWAELNNTKTLYLMNGCLSSNPKTLHFILGDVKGYTLTPDVTFLGTAIDTSKIASHERTSANLVVTTDSAYLDTNSTVGIGVYAKSGTEGGLNYTNLIPAEQPDYDYYIWRVWSRNAITGVNFGNTTVNFAAGWNEIRLTWEQLTNTDTKFQRIYMTGLSSSQINVALGSLTGHYNGENAE